MPKEHDQLDFLEEELSLFETYRRQRSAPNFSILQQKKHAEAMLQVYRPKLYKFYFLRKQGWSQASIGKKYSLTENSVRSRLKKCVHWLRSALVGDDPT